MYTIFLIFNIVIDIALMAALYWLLRPLVRGAVYFPTTPEGVGIIKRLADAKPGELVADLGSGDGRIVMAFASEGSKTHGFEIDPWLVWKSRKAIKDAGLEKRAFVHWKSFWRADLSQYDVIAVYAFPTIMKRLERKLERELKPGARIVSNIYEFPNWKPTKKEGGVTLYIR